MSLAEKQRQLVVKLAIIEDPHERLERFEVGAPDGGVDGLFHAMVAGDEGGIGAPHGGGPCLGRDVLLG